MLRLVHLAGRGSCGARPFLPRAGECEGRTVAPIIFLLLRPSRSFIDYIEGKAGSAYLLSLGSAETCSTLYSTTLSRWSA